MTFLLKQLFSLIRLLNSETGEQQISTGIALGFILGMTPAISIQTILVFICLFVFRIQIGMAFLSAFFFAFIAWILDPLFHAVGSFILQLPALQGFFTSLYNMPIIPFTRFNNTIVMGSGVIAILLSPFVYLIGKSLVIKYRVVVVERYQQTKLWKTIKATSLYQWYYSYDKLYG